MKKAPHCRQTRQGRTLRRGTPEHDVGLCTLMLMELTQDCSPQGRRRRSELAQDMAKGQLRHRELVLAV